MGKTRPRPSPEQRKTGFKVPQGGFSYFVSFVFPFLVSCAGWRSQHARTCAHTQGPAACQSRSKETFRMQPQCGQRMADDIGRSSGQNTLWIWEGPSPSNFKLVLDMYFWRRAHSRYDSFKTGAEHGTQAVLRPALPSQKHKVETQA